MINIGNWINHLKWKNKNNRFCSYPELFYSDFVESIENANDREVSTTAQEAQEEGR